MNNICLICCLFLALTAATHLQDSFHLEYPEYFPEPTYAFENNPLSKDKIALGRALFYDPILSLDSTISCASCHSPYNAFAHTDHDLSHGIHDSIGIRNAPALFNLAWQQSFMWDGAINHLDVQALAPITHHAEMGENLAHVLQKLQRKALYPPLFERAFGDSIITGEYLMKAFSQFQLSLISDNSTYDQVKLGNATFTEQEKKGYQLFQQHCNSCHTEPLFSSYQFANNGLTIDTGLQDMGRWRISHQAQDSLMFKIPSLRNLSFTYPYMHDGRFRSLREVVNHYSGKQLTHVDSSIPPVELPTFSPEEKVDLIAFLLSLNDRSFVFDRSHQYPRDIFH